MLNIDEIDPGVRKLVVRRAPFVGRASVVPAEISLGRPWLRRAAGRQTRPHHTLTRHFATHALRLAYAALERRRARGES